jgi:hypothetical protein
MRHRFFLFGFLFFVVAVTTALAPLSFAMMLRNRARARGITLVAHTRRRVAAVARHLIGVRT